MFAALAQARGQDEEPRLHAKREQCDQFSNDAFGENISVRLSPPEETP